MAICLARGHGGDPLGQEVSPGMINRGPMALIVDRCGQAFGQTNLAVDPTQEEGPTIRREGAPCEGGAESMPRSRRQTQLFWARMEHKQTACGFYGIDASHIPFSQRLTRGGCVCMKNSG